MKFFTADFHLGMDDILKYENRPFSNVNSMNTTLLKECCTKTTENDIIYHVGDLGTLKSSYSEDRFDVTSLVSVIPAMFINIRGNHDVSNRMKFACESMRIQLSRRFPNVSIGHYPSYDPRAKDSFIDGDVHVCGHVHGKWRHCLDLDHSVLNVNVGVDVWNFQLVTEQMLINYLEKIFKAHDSLLVKAKQKNGKTVIFTNKQ